LMRQTSSALLAVLCIGAVISPAWASSDLRGQNAMNAMKRLSYLTGTWRCVTHGGDPNTSAMRLRYNFIAGGRWLVEQSDVKGSPEWDTVQLWGYEPRLGGLVAFQFTQYGLATKQVSGWNGDTFSGTRTDNGAKVSVKRTGPNTMRWTIHPNGSGTAKDITQDCTR
ncbi:MAG TPA: hypothetical protein VFL13_14110, partial [Candidatus Baltobacteraceae bacterium]|nr:hypothetical protein [Candidatus Baltobacteraceae bacterium]